MTVFFLAVILVFLFGAKFNLKGCFEDYLAPKQTRAVNGLFVMLVFMSHFKQYIACGHLDGFYWSLSGKMGQLIVTTFLFYSGYGIMTSIKNKEGYVKKLPKRIARVWLQFALAVCLFLALNMVMKNKYDAATILLSFTAWDAIGNSNWYIFAILVMYASTYFAALLAKEDKSRIVILVTVAAAVYCLAMKFAHKADWWYDTIFCYPFGLAFAEYKTKIDSFLDNNKKYWITLLSVMVLMISYAATNKLSGLFFNLFAVAFHELFALVFVLIVVLLTRKVSFGNKILDYLGQHTFEIYILQRLPMIALAPLELNKYVYFAVSLLITIIISTLFKQATKKAFALIKL